MKNIRILLISIPAIIIISAVIGCAITFSTAPHAALARVFIDIGALIALVLITYSLPKPEPIQIDDIVDGLRDLAKNRFDRRLSIKEQDELFQVRQAFNELAGTLSDGRDPSLTHIRYNPMNRIELRVTPLPSIHHSHHPELGQVKSAEELALLEAKEALAKMKESEPVEEPQPERKIFAREDLPPEPETLREATSIFPTVLPSAELDEETYPSELAFESSQDEAFESFEDFETKPEPEAVVEASHVAAPLAVAAAPVPPAPIEEPAVVPEPKRPETYPSGIGAADLFFLFERFKAAHDSAHQNNVDFDDFMMTVQKAREDLIRAHHCRDVKFEVVTDAGAVALRPRLIR